MREIVDRLRRERNLPRAQMRDLLLCEDAAALEYLHAQARAVREEAYGKDVYIRALVEFTNYCKNDCLYCGIRRSNHRAQRYRLSQEDILACAQKGYALGFRTVVLQGGEDPHFTDARLCADRARYSRAFAGRGDHPERGRTARRATARCSRREPIATCSGTKPRTRRTMRSCIRRNCRWSTAWAA